MRRFGGSGRVWLRRRRRRGRRDDISTLAGLRKNPRMQNRLAKEGSKARRDQILDDRTAADFGKIKGKERGVVHIQNRLEDGWNECEIWQEFQIQDYYAQQCSSLGRRCKHYTT